MSLGPMALEHMRRMPLNVHLHIPRALTGLHIAYFLCNSQGDRIVVLVTRGF